MADIRETGVSGLKYGEGTLNNNSSEINFEELMSNIGSLKKASALELNTIFKPSYSEPVGVKLAQAGYGNSTYDENAVSDWDLDNLNEVRAANQPGILLLGNGALKMVSTGVTTFLDSTVGALYGLGTGIGNAVTAEDGERGEAFIRGLWDNDFNKAMTSIQDGMEELLPNYYSQDELNSPWYSNILSANFIGDKVLKNMGFTIGALGAMALTGGVGGAIGKGALAASKFALGNLGKALGASRGTLAGINNFARGTGQFSNWLVNTAISANGEAAIEAINALKEGLKDAYANLESRRLELIDSLDPDSPDYYTQLNAIDLASLEYKNEIDTLFRDAGNSVYLANLAILGASNTLEFGHILKGGFGKSARLADHELRVNGEKVGLSDWIKAGIRGEKIGVENTVDKGFGRIAGITAKNILTEGTEEATQNLASNTAKLLAKAKGNEFAENSILGARINPEVTDELTDYTKAFSKALYDNFGSPESPGWEEFFLGGLTGGMGFMSLGRVKQKDAEGNYVIDPKTLKIMTKLRPIWEGGFMLARRQVNLEYEDNQRIVDAVNERLQDPEFIKRFQHSVASLKFSEDMSAALERNDMVEFKNSDMGRITNDVFFFRDAGMIDEYKALYKQMAQGIDDKTLEQLYTATADENGNTALALEDIEKVRREYLDKALRMLDKIEMVQQYYDFVDKDYRDRSPLFKEELAYLYIRLDDTNRRIKQLKDKAPSEISATLSALKGYFKEGNELNLGQYYNDNLTDLERLDLERLERLKKQYEEKIKEYTKNPEKLDRDINLAYLEGEAKRASLDALSLIKQLKEAKTAKEVDSIIAFADESVREEVWKAAYQDGDDEVKEKIEMAIETLNAFAKTKERLQKLFRGIPGTAEIFEDMMRNLYINNELNPEKIREAMKAFQQGIEAENLDALSQYTNAFEFIADLLFGEENKKTKDLMLNFLESSQEQLGNTLRELQKYKTARETSLRVKQQQQLQQQLLKAALNLQQLAKANKDHLSKIQLNKALRKAISKGTHVAVKKYGKDKLNELIDKVIAQGNFEGSETDIESVLNTLSNVFLDKYGKERSTAGVLDTINRFSNSNINPYRKAVGQVLQQQYNSQQQQQPQQQESKDYLSIVKNAQELALEIKSGTHVAIQKLGRDKVNSILGAAIAEGNLAGDEADIENLMNLLQDIFSQSSDADIKNMIDTFATKLNVYKKSIGKALQKEWTPNKSAPNTSKEDAKEEAEAVLKALQRTNIHNATTEALEALITRASKAILNPDTPLDISDKISEAMKPVAQEITERNERGTGTNSSASKTEDEWKVDPNVTITKEIANNEFGESYNTTDERVNKYEQPRLKTTADYLNGKLNDRDYLAAMGLATGENSWLDDPTTTKEEIAERAKKMSEPRKKYLKNNQNLTAGANGGQNGSNQNETFKVLDKNVEALLSKFYKKLGRQPLTFTMEEQKQIAQNMEKALNLVNNSSEIPDDLKAYEDIILANKTDNNLPALTEDNPFIVGSDDEFNGIWAGLYDVSGTNPLQTEHKANLANKQRLAAHYGSVENAKKVQWVVDYLLKDIKDAPVNLITYVGGYFPNGNPKTTIYTAIKVSDIRGDQRKRTARTKGWIQTVDEEDYLVIGILGASSNSQAQIDNYEAIRAGFDDQISSLNIAEGWHASTNPAHVMQITNIGDGRFAMNQFDLNNWNSDDIVELLTGPNKELSNPLQVDPKKGQLKFSILYEDEPKFVNKSSKDVVRRGSANLQPGKMHVLIPTPNGAYYRFPIREITIDESKEHYKLNGSDNKFVKEVDRLISAIIDKQEVKDIIALKNLLVLENESEELSFFDIYFDNGEIRVEYIPRMNEAHSRATKNSVFLDASNKDSAKAQLSDIIYNQIRPFINVNLSNTSSWEGVKKLSEAGALRLKRPLAVFSFVGANYTVKPATTKKGSKPEEKRKRLSPVINEQLINFNGRTIFLRDTNFYEKESLITDPKELEILRDLVAINNGNYVGETIYKKKNKLLIPLLGTYYFVGRNESLYIYHKDVNGNFTKLTGSNVAEILSKRKNKPSTAASSFTISVETASALLEEKMNGQLNAGNSKKELAEALELSEEDMQYYPQAKAWLDNNWESAPYISALLRVLRIGYNRATRLIEAWKAEKNKPTGASSNGLNISVETATPELVKALQKSTDATAPFIEGLKKATTNQLVTAVLKAATEANIRGTLSEEQFKYINEAVATRLSELSNEKGAKVEARKLDAIRRATYDLELKKGIKIGDIVEASGTLATVVGIEYDEGIASIPSNDTYGYSDIPGTVVLILSANNNQPYSYGVTRFLNSINNKKINKQSQKSLKGLDNSNNNSTFVGRLKDSSDSEGGKLLDFLYEKIDDINASMKTTIDADNLTLSQLIQTYKDILDIDLATLPSDITQELLEDIINCKL